MRLLVLIVCLTLAAGALAEEKPKPRTVIKQIDKSSPVLANTTGSENPGDATEAADAKEKANKTKTRAQDYNSSRSNTTSLAGDPKGDISDFGMSRTTERSKGQRGDEASGGKRQGGLHAEGVVHRDVAARSTGHGADYNSSRSNKTHAARQAGGRDLGKENRCSVGRLDCDDDGDSVPSNASCGNGIDNDCDDVDTRAAPANHNTTRSNRTQPTDEGDDPVVRKRPGKN